VGRRRVTSRRSTDVRQRNQGRRRAPFRRRKRLRAAGFGGNRAGDLRAPHLQPGLVGHRLQRPRRQVRSGIRGPIRRDDQSGSGHPHRRVQPQHVGGLHDRVVRRSAPHAGSGAHRRAPARVAAGHGWHRPARQRRVDIGRRTLHLFPPRRRGEPAAHLCPSRCRQY